MNPTSSERIVLCDVQNKAFCPPLLHNYYVIGTVGSTVDLAGTHGTVFGHLGLEGLFSGMVATCVHMIEKGRCTVICSSLDNTTLW